MYRIISNPVLSVAGALLLLAPSPASAAQEAESRRAAATVEALRMISGGADVGPALGGATLTRDKRSVHASIHAADLEPGHVYTVWWIIFNKPSACLSVPCSSAEEADNPASGRSVLWATGFIAGAKGIANVSFRLDRRATPGLVVAGDGLTNVKRAEIHVALVDHGPPDPDTIVEEMSTPGPASRAAVFFPE